MKHMTAIASAVEPLRTSAIERARKEASDYAERVFAKHAEDPTYHAYPRNSWSREYAVQKARYHRFRALTTNGERDDKKVVNFIDDAAERASQQYTIFIQKLESKVGIHIAATLTGDHVWGHSILTITKADGLVEKWKTQQIINVSVLGKFFHQWPTRKLKS